MQWSLFCHAIFFFVFLLVSNYIRTSMDAFRFVTLCPLYPFKYYVAATAPWNVFDPWLRWTGRQLGQLG